LSLPAFFWRYLRGYAAWGVLAGAGILVYAAATAGSAALIKPIFAEVLLAGDRMPAGLSALTSEPAEASGSGGGSAASKAEEEKAPAGPAWLEDARKRLNLSRQIDSTYASLKRRFGIGPSEVVYFVPALFVLVFLLRSLADFTSGYAFQHIGLGVTTDIRNSLYRRILDQSSRFHSEHPSGELVARVVNDVAKIGRASCRERVS
jgi:ABC-type multidrug transport system fused ATPase/permease subunit